MDIKVNVNFKVLEKVRDDFKDKCTTYGMPMQTVLGALMEDFIKDGAVNAVIVRKKE